MGFLIKIIQIYIAMCIKRLPHLAQNEKQINIKQEF